jgi:hypothetical protein
MTPDLARQAAGLLWLAGHGDDPTSRYSWAVDVGREHRALVQSGVPESLAADAMSEALTPSPALAAVQRWADYPRPAESWDDEDAPTHSHRTHGCLALVGPVGTGKSVALAHLLRLRVRAGIALTNGKAGDRSWLDCRTLVGGDFSRVNKIPDHLERPCLVLDDLSADVTAREPARSALAALLAVRHESRKLTLVSTNLSTAAFAEAIGPAATDRIKQCGEVVDCRGESRRTGPLLDLARPIRDAAKLVELVDLLEQHRSAPPEAAVAQLGRLLGATHGDARRAADEAERVHAFGVEALAECRRKLEGFGTGRPNSVERALEQRRRDDERRAVLAGQVAEVRAREGAE